MVVVTVVLPLVYVILGLSMASLKVAVTTAESPAINTLSASLSVIVTVGPMVSMVKVMLSVPE